MNILDYSQWKPGSEGAFAKVPEPIYRKSEGLNHSLLKEIRPTPAHLIHAIANPKVPTWEMRVGTIVHAAILEPEKELPGIALKPSKPGFLNSNEGKAWKEAAQKRGDIILGEDAHESMLRAIESCKSNKRLADVCESAHTELSIWATPRREGPGVLRKGRLDIVPTKYACLCDIKVVDDACEESFSKKLYDMEYAAQAEWYLRLWNDAHGLEGKDALDIFIFHVVERPTGFIAHYPVHPAALEWGRQRNNADLEKYIECRRSNHWPNYPQEPVICNLPVYAFNRPVV